MMTGCQADVPRVRVAASIWLTVVVAVIVGAGGCKAAEEPKPMPRNRDASVQMPADGCLRTVGAAAFEAGQACACASDCNTGNCLAGKCCSGSACAPKRPDGAKCAADGDCESKFCTDGVCCNKACRGPCQVCNLPIALGECNDADEGQPDPHKLCAKEPVSTCGTSGLCDGNGACAKYQDDTICRPELCEGISLYGPPGTCDGKGKCILEKSESCDPARCENSRCVITCASDAQCAPGKACVNGACGEFPAGRTCAKGDDCLSGHCVDGVCCDTACDGICQTCAATGRRGICGPVSAGTVDPMCDVEAPSTCQTSGRCDGAGKCALYDNNTVCRPATCDDARNSASPAVRCNNGTCPAAPPENDCEPFQGCNGISCRSSCSTDSQCIPGRVCSGGRCVEPTTPPPPPPPPPADAG